VLVETESSFFARLQAPGSLSANAFLLSYMYARKKKQKNQKLVIMQVHAGFVIACMKINNKATTLRSERKIPFLYEKCQNQNIDIILMKKLFYQMIRKTYEISSKMYKELISLNYVRFTYLAFSPFCESICSFGNNCIPRRNGSPNQNFILFRLLTNSKGDLPCIARLLEVR